FAHNGDLRGFKPRLHGAFRPVGGTDSEHAFCWLMQELAKAHASVPSVEELGCTLQELLPQPAQHGTFNLLLSNGQALWAHCSTHLHVLERAHPFGPAQLADEDLRVDFAAHTTPQVRVAFVSTTPLSAGEPWQPLTAGEMRVLVGGRTVSSTHCH
ncbi:MAG: class II glutamine amidotransferase, partial [Rubrivivax sp.]|nr:class II glutamine amidotransferase [Rubrivivax sp.]